jgi:hypothetical protein
MVITVFTVFRLLTDFVCLYTYEFWLFLCKIVRSSVNLLLPLFHTITTIFLFYLADRLIQLILFNKYVIIINSDLFLLCQKKTKKNKKSTTNTQTNKTKTAGNPNKNSFHMMHAWKYDYPSIIHSSAAATINMCKCIHISTEELDILYLLFNI